jgi:hypothetical protein
MLNVYEVAETTPTNRYSKLGAVVIAGLAPWGSIGASCLAADDPAPLIDTAALIAGLNESIAVSRASTGVTAYGGNDSLMWANSYRFESRVVEDWAEIEYVGMDHRSGLLPVEGLDLKGDWVRYAERVVFQPAAASDVSAISETVDQVMRYVETFGPQNLSLFLVRAESIQPEHMVAVLRSTFQWKDDVEGWTHALNQTAEALRRSGYDSDDVLVGLA